METPQFVPGQKVHYIPFEGCDDSQYENGIIKCVNRNYLGHYFVVFHCADDWDNYQDYTGQNTSEDQLRAGWIERNCAFQYAKISGSMFMQTEIVVDKTRITLGEAKRLWNKYYPDCARHIKDGGIAEMVIWINMQTPTSYGETLEYISTDAESDGITIWHTEKRTFTKEFQEDTK